MNAFFGLVLLGAAYGLGSLAVDTGRWLFYFLTFLTLVAAVKFGALHFRNNAKK
jgi:hypothetical protein